MIKSIFTVIAISTTLTVTAQRITREQYVNMYKDKAISEMQRSGIPASITLAQGILESDCGNSYLATTANNHFGIKCAGGWTGATAYHDDDQKQECFRSYDSAEESYNDHTDFLVSKPRYASLFQLASNDYKGWAEGLSKCGYATDPNYPERLITIIEQLNLAQFDSDEPTTYIAQDTETPKEVYDAPAVRADASFMINPIHVHKVEYNNGVRYIKVIKGDTWEGIAREFHLMVSELLRYNDLDASAKIGDMKYLYIRSKRNRAHSDCQTHTVREGETMWSIAHNYGMKLRRLRRFNHMAVGQEPATGEVLNLRSSK
ncbi:MAG: glucosaminidase domain-containing protein [Bacteroidales bacterium]|nr:glucosaminidase domain-containing protein [Bacteroidales bacterium]